MKKILSFITAYCLYLTASAQYAPQAGVAGSTAISQSSSLFTGWATHCDVQRGWMDINNKTLGPVSAGDSSFAVGAPDGFIVSLGDSGVAVLTFAHPLVNGTGPDFAVFENGFANPANAEEAYLELAFVEVSSDGINYFRFPATSLTPDTGQIAGVGTYMNARALNNLAGKYIGTYGTPFDLQDLAGKPGLNVNNITHVRLVDVVGSLGAHASYDSAGHKINDPYPTAFPTGGFDLDAVGVINQANTAVNQVTANTGILVYPNPATDKIIVRLPPATQAVITVADITGKVLQQISGGETTEISLAAYAHGLYYFTVRDTKGNQWTEKVSKL
ncbi:T9SS type A sorting domain-containing protein [Chitinophagaceae bacterium MMS25-I14]